ncbi:MAG: integrase arm-type DNA-binding domain-containing protein [Thiotrichaceae bacterium]|nr:integrase arm-type DNA-binding domain-containing protein [Thiotrichaceae bacterium]
MKQLTVRYIKSLKIPGRYSDNLNGLYLQVTKTGLKSWIFRYSRNGKRREMGLGRIDHLDLVDARKKASELSFQVKQDKTFDPINQRKQSQQQAITESVNTFEKCMTDFIEIKSKEWTNKKHAQQWTNTLTTYALPVLKDMHIKDIQTEHIKQILNPIWHTKTETATRVRNRLEQIIDFATAHKYRSGENPARWRGHLDKMLPKPSKIRKVRHHPALPYKKMPDFMIKLRSRDSMSALALEFLILTASRTGEIIKAHWNEIDFEKAEWTRPSENMKTDISHTAPLSPRAMEIIKHLFEHKQNDYVFTGQTKAGGLSNAAMDKLLQVTLRYSECTVHGFRSTFRDWTAEETSTPNHIAEMALAHKVNNETEAAYRRGDLLEKRRILMNAWQSFIENNSI